ncbi:MAG: hypothetical protein KKF67_03335 [Nanoarchaeota archaeon]|nr:hypothetical protein [Nanoarchaeota archaeon]
MGSYVISEGGANTSSENYSTDFSIGEITGNLSFGDAVNLIGFWYAILDTVPPKVTIISPTAITYTSSSVAVQIDLDESGYCEYSLNSGTTNITLTPNASSSSFTGTASGLSNQAYVLSAYCNDSLGNKNYTESVAFTVNVPAVTPGGGGTTGGETGAEVTTSLISVEPSTINLNLVINTNKEQIIKVTNLGASSMNLSVRQQNLDMMVIFDKTTLELASGESKDLNVIFIALNQTGIFTGNIIIGTKTIPVSLNVRTKQLLFDSNIVVLNENYTVEQGDKLKTKVTLIPMGEKERLDVTLNYVIKDYNGKIYLTQKETLLVEEQMDFKRNFDTGILPVGKYIVGLELVYTNGVAPSSAHFEVVEKTPTDIFGKIVFFLVIVILIILILIVILLIRRTLKKKIREKALL